tara:strand:+ start:996 stop:1385 length:390 start_codon:yes stop_codon:yes gene_type:complete
MNIYGIGTDIVNISRIKSAIKKNSSYFKKRVFTNFEIKICDKRTNNVECFAKRFAAKEALFKAIGHKNKLSFKEVEIRNNTSGMPNFYIKGTSLLNLKKLFKNKKFKIHLSLSDDKPWAVASVVVFTYK